RHTRSKRDWSSDVCSSDLYNRRVIYIPLTLALLAFPISQGGLYCGILYKLKKLIGDCQSAFYYLNLIRSLKLQRSKQYEELAEEDRKSDVKGRRDGVGRVR